MRIRGRYRIGICPFARCASRVELLDFMSRFIMKSAYEAVSIGFGQYSGKGVSGMTVYRFAAVIEGDADGYFAYCPDLQGCCTSGATYEEARTNLADAIRLHVEDRLANGEEIKTPESVNLTTVEVAV